MSDPAKTDEEEFKLRGCLPVLMFFGVLAGGLFLLFSVILLVMKLKNTTSPVTPQRLAEIERPESKAILSAMKDAVRAENGNVIPAVVDKEPVADGATCLIQPGTAITIVFPAVRTINGENVAGDASVRVTRGNDKLTELRIPGEKSAHWDDKIRYHGEEDVYRKIAFPLTISTDQRGQYLEFESDLVLHVPVENDLRTGFVVRSKTIKRRGKLLVVTPEDFKLFDDERALQQFTGAGMLPWWLVLLSCGVSLVVTWGAIVGLRFFAKA